MREVKFENVNRRTHWNRLLQFIYIKGLTDIAVDFAYSLSCIVLRLRNNLRPIPQFIHEMGVG